MFRPEINPPRGPLRIVAAVFAMAAALGIFAFPRAARIAAALLIIGNVLLIVDWWKFHHQT